MPDTREVLDDDFMRILISWRFSYLLPWILHAFESFLVICFSQAGGTYGAEGGEGRPPHWTDSPGTLVISEASHVTAKPVAV